MLRDLLFKHRNAIVNSAKARMRSRRPRSDGDKMAVWISSFLEQVQTALSEPLQTVHSSCHEERGQDLLQMGFTIGQVVHDYGDICQAVTQVSAALDSSISAKDFQVLNLCLDNAIAGAVTGYSSQVEKRIQGQSAERLGSLAHELRNLIGVALLSFGAIQEGRVAVAGSTGVVLHRSLLGLRNLVDRSLTYVRVESGIEHFEVISVAELVEEVEIGGLLQAQNRGLTFTVGAIDREPTVEGDRQTLASVLSNLLQNAFKFTHKNGSVNLSVRVTDDSVFFDVEDECGGLPPGKPEDLFTPYEQKGLDKSGVGLGLSICVKAARSNGGEVSVVDLPGRGCVFTLRLPRYRRPPLKSIPGGGSGGTSSGPAPVTGVSQTALRAVVV